MLFLLCQIGITRFVALLSLILFNSLTNFRSLNLDINDKRVRETASSKRLTASKNVSLINQFFAHYDYCDRIKD